MNSRYIIFQKKVISPIIHVSGYTLSPHRMVISIK